jgi:hypothetical protein
LSSIVVLPSNESIGHINIIIIIIIIIIITTWSGGKGIKEGKGRCDNAKGKIGKKCKNARILRTTHARILLTLW